MGWKWDQIELLKPHVPKKKFILFVLSSKSVQIRGFQNGKEEGKNDLNILHTVAGKCWDLLFIVGFGCCPILWRADDANNCGRKANLATSCWEGRGIEFTCCQEPFAQTMKRRNDKFSPSAGWTIQKRGMSKFDASETRLEDLPQPVVSFQVVNPPNLRLNYGTCCCGTCLPTGLYTGIKSLQLWKKTFQTVYHSWDVHSKYRFNLNSYIHPIHPHMDQMLCFFNAFYHPTRDKVKVDQLRLVLQRAATSWRPFVVPQIVYRQMPQQSSRDAQTCLCSGPKITNLIQNPSPNHVTWISLG